MDIIDESMDIFGEPMDILHELNLFDGTVWILILSSVYFLLATLLRNYKNPSMFRWSRPACLPASGSEFDEAWVPSASDSAPPTASAYDSGLFFTVDPEFPSPQNIDIAALLDLPSPTSDDSGIGEQNLKNQKNAKRCKDYRKNLRSIQEKKASEIDDLTRKNTELKEKEKFLRQQVESLKKKYIDLIITGRIQVL